MSDPTDNALAAIASILDQTTTPPDKSKSSDTKSSDKTADKASEPAEEPPVSIAMPPPLPSSVEVVTVEAVSVKTVSVEIAPAEPTTVEQPPIEEPELLVEQSEPSETELSEPEPSVPEPEPEPIQPPEPIEANGYSKSGPGPMAALRFRWTVREDGAQYYVDETVGEGSTPLVNGPMDRDAAIKFVDEREAEARRRFEHFKHEIVSRTAAALQASKDRHEA
ncbi:hypothetical protein [Bradyrhizobium quebecense]|uniref:Uncharacterized protein n=2 Tax=Bradyrhizobium quebecense TaxID=2748629 RepID=A0ACD3V9F7_9BRAD|nr:hypothetical protein [Bradyrhizobium quebecense]UGY03050.1 hypothetical protein J4P68_0039345 [Bradyrhizobium quebecense]